MEGFYRVLDALLSSWEAIKAAEAQRAQQEAELYKNKTQTSTFQTEEVRWPLKDRYSHSLHLLGTPVDHSSCISLLGFKL